VYNHKLKSAGTPIAYHFGSRYPFGFGLSYTQFQYGALEWVNRQADIGDGQFEFTFEVENIGGCDGTEVVQIYVTDRVASVVRPVRELKGFQRVFVPAGARRTVRVRLPVDMLNFTDERGERIVEPGEFQIMVGSSSRDVRLSGSVVVAGDATRTLERDWRMLCDVSAGDVITSP
jgi:beta-glucosidase